jgi:hypothetical protein
VALQKVSALLNPGPLKSGRLSLGNVQVTLENATCQKKQLNRCHLLNMQRQPEQKEQEKQLENSL